MRKFLILLIVLVSLLLLGAPVIHAQEATTTPNTGWPVEERCVGAPTKPPKDWSYDGTIIVEDNYGIHGINPDLKTPYYIGYAGDNFYSKGEFSPNGEWYAVPSGRTDRYLSGTDYGYEIDEIRIYSTDPQQKLIRLPWSASFRGLAPHGEYAILQIRWIDDEHLIYMTGSSMLGNPTAYIINPFTGEQEILKTDLTSLKFLTISPDFKRTVSLQDGPRVLDFSTGQELNTLPANLRSLIFWQPDSSGFVTFTSNNKNIKIYLYDRNGEFNEIIYDAPIESFFNIAWQWGSDSDQFAFVINNSKLLIGTISQKKIIDLCTTASGIAFSSENEQLAYGYYSSKGTHLIAILNMKSWVSYIGGYYSGAPIKWIRGKITTTKKSRLGGKTH